VLFSVGVLGSLDMEFLWREVTDIVNKHGIVAGGDAGMETQLWFWLMD
jgi:methanol--5-hydroxybenzimidazolylcobamide Co-methyltransferase